MKGHEIYHVWRVLADEGPRDINCAHSVRLNSDFPEYPKGSNSHKLPLLTKCGLCASVWWKFHFFFFWTENRLETVCKQCWRQCSQRETVTFVRMVFDVFKASEDVTAVIKISWSLITVCHISVCISELFLPVFYACLFLFFHTCFAREKNSSVRSNHKYLPFTLS